MVLVNVIFVSIWLLCGFLFYGWSWAYWVRAFPDGRTWRKSLAVRAHTIFIAIFCGPIALFAWVLYIRGWRSRGEKVFYGFLLRGEQREPKREIN